MSITKIMPKPEKFTILYLVDFAKLETWAHSGLFKKGLITTNSIISAEMPDGRTHSIRSEAFRAYMSCPQKQRRPPCSFIRAFAMREFDETRTGSTPALRKRFSASRSSARMPQGRCRTRRRNSRALRSRSYRAEPCSRQSYQHRLGSVLRHGVCM